MTDKQPSGNKKRKVEGQLDSEATLSEGGNSEPPSNHGSAVAVQDEDSMTDAQRLEAKRAYNRTNSARSRHRQKQKIVDLSAKVEEQSKQIEILQQTNGELVHQVQALESEKSQLNIILQVFLRRAAGPGSGQAASAASSTAALGSSATRGLQLAGLQQASNLGLLNQPVGATTNSVPASVQLAALLGKINEAEMPAQTTGTTAPSIETLLSPGANIFRRPEVPGQAASPTLAATVPPTAPVSPRTALSRLLSGNSPAASPPPPPAQHTATDVAAFLSLLGRNNAARAAAPEPRPQGQSIAMELLALSQQRKTEELLQILLAQQQQQGASRNDDSGSDTDASAQKPRVVHLN